MVKHASWLFWTSLSSAGLAIAGLVIPGCGGPSGTDAGIDTGSIGTDTGGTDSGGGVDTGVPMDAGVRDAPADVPPVGPAVITIQDGCPAFAACGGAIVGTWNYQSICIEESGIEALFMDQCPGTEILNGSGSGSGVLTITSTEITRDITTAITAQVQIGSTTCINICTAIPAVVRSMVPGADATCTASGSGTEEVCLCDVTFNTMLSETNAYEIQGGDTIVTSPGAADERRFEYCVEADGSLRTFEPGGEPGVGTSTMM